MKFAALVLLLVVGSQAASLQADAPAHLAQFRAMLKDSATKILAPFDDTSYKASKDKAIETVDTRLGTMFEMAQTLIATADDATADIRATIKADVEQFKTSTTADAEKVRENILKHLQEYVGILGGLKEYVDTKKTELEGLKTKVTEVAGQIGEKVPANWEETKTSLEPIMEQLKTYFTKYSDQAKQQVMPYVTEYMETAQKHMENPAEGAALIEELKTKMAVYLNAMVESLNKS